MKIYSCHNDSTIFNTDKWIKYDDAMQTIQKMAEYVKHLDATLVAEENIIKMYDDFNLTKMLINKKNNIINRMAEYISKQDIDEDICKKIIATEIDFWDCCNKECAECIIQHFSELNKEIGTKCIENQK